MMDRATVDFPEPGFSDDPQRLTGSPMMKDTSDTA